MYKKSTEIHFLWKYSYTFSSEHNNKWLLSLDKKWQVADVLWGMIIIYTSVPQIITVTGYKDKSELEELLNTYSNILNYIYFHF